MNIIGQNKLLDKLNTYTIDNLPHQLLFIGDEGCGKHTICKYLSTKFDFPLVEITTDTTAEMLTDYLYNPLPTFYLIDFDTFTDKQQNKVLKFIEEPAVTVYIVAITTSDVGILPTVLNRCIKLYFEPYTIETLRQIKNATDPIAYELCGTPGSLLTADLNSLPAIQSCCENVLKSLVSASCADIFKFALLVNYKEEYDKFDFNLTINMFNHVAFNLYKDSADELFYKLYLVTSKYKQNLVLKPLKEQYMMHLLLELCEVAD